MSDLVVGAGAPFAHGAAMGKPDRRTERTRTALMRSFVSAMLSEGYEAVTVERVAEQADVGRSTFYMHFKSKEDILSQSMARPSSVLAVLVGNDLPPAVLVKQLAHFHDQRRRNSVFFEGRVRRVWVQCLSGLIEPRLAKLARLIGAQPVLPLPLAALQIAETQLALIGNWLTVRPGTKADAIAEALIASTDAAVESLLRSRGPLRIPGERFEVREG